MARPSTAGGARAFPRAADRLLQVRIVSARDDRLTVQLRGELDLMSAELLDGMLANYPNRRYVRLELGELSFIDGAGLRALTVEHHRLRDRHGELVLAGVGARMHRLLTITGLDNLLHTVATPRSATRT